MAGPLSNVSRTPLLPARALKPQHGPTQAEATKATAPEQAGQLESPTEADTAPGIDDAPAPWTGFSYVLPDTPESWKACAENIKTDADQRVEMFKTTIQGHGKFVHPPRQESVTSTLVKLVLLEMKPHTPALHGTMIEPDFMDDPRGLFVEGVLLQTEVIPQSDGQLSDGKLRFGPGVKLTAKGREMIAAYYARKYNADIVFSDSFGVDSHALDREFIDKCRARPGEAVRCALYVGHKGNDHGSTIIYMREGGADGKEALLWFDSTADQDKLQVGRDITHALEPFRRNGKPIPVYQHIRGLQYDWQSCWVYAMKTAVTLTGSERDGCGGFGGFLVPDLIKTLEDRRLGGFSLPIGVKPVWGLPEVVRTSQILKSVIADAGDEMDQQLRGAKPGMTLRIFLEKYAYTTADGMLLLDYVRQKGERLAEVLQVEAWSQMIGEYLRDEQSVAMGGTAGPVAELWGPREQDEFAHRMKVYLRGQHFSAEDNIETLPSRLPDPPSFIDQALKAHHQIMQASIKLGDHASHNRLGELSAHALDEIGQMQDETARLLTDLQAQLAQCFHHYWQTEMPQAVGIFETQIMPALQGSMDLLATERTVLARERERRDDVLRDAVQATMQQDLVGAVDALADTSADELADGMTTLLEGINDAGLGLGNGPPPGEDLDLQSDAQLQAHEARLEVHSQLLERAVDRFHEITDSLLPEKAEVSSDGMLILPDRSAINDSLVSITKDLSSRQTELAQVMDARAALRAETSLGFEPLEL